MTEYSEQIAAADIRGSSGREIAKFLTDVIGLEDAEVGRLAGVHEGSVRRWRSADPDVGQPRPESDQKLRRVAGVVSFMVNTMQIEPLERIAYFLRTPTIDPETLEAETPLVQIGDGSDLKPIIELARAVFPAREEAQ